MSFDASLFFFFFSSRRRHTRCSRDWSSDVCSSDLEVGAGHHRPPHLLHEHDEVDEAEADRKSTRLNSSHGYISYAVFCLKKKNTVAGTPSVTIQITIGGGNNDAPVAS